MRDFALNIAASILLALEALKVRTTHAFRFLWRIAVWLLFVPFFGIAGTHFRGSRGLDWMSYNVNHRRVVIQRTKGKTAFLYTVFGVGPIAYLKMIDREDVRPLLDKYAWEGSWRWRWNGKLTSRMRNN